MNLPKYYFRLFLALDCFCPNENFDFKLLCSLQVNLLK